MCRSSDAYNNKNLTAFHFFQHQALTGSLVVGAGSATEADPFKRQQVMPSTGMPGVTNNAVVV